MSDYPQTVIEVLRPTMRFRAGVIAAMQRFAHDGPWSGTIAERKQKFRALNAALAAACAVPEPDLVFENLDGGSSGRSYYAPRQHRIVLVGGISVVTYLHEFAHAREMDEQAACAWSINLFRAVFPRQYGGLIHQGHMLIRPRDAPLARRDSFDPTKDRRHAAQSG